MNIIFNIQIEVYLPRILKNMLTYYYIMREISCDIYHLNALKLK